MGELIKEVLTSAWFYNPIEISGLELPLHFALRLNAFGYDLAPTDGFESKSRFILTEETYWSGQSSDRYGIPSQQGESLSEFFSMPRLADLRSLYLQVLPLWVRL